MPSRWRLSCCADLGSQRLFQPGSSPGLPQALCCPCRVPRVLPWRMSHGWAQRWSYSAERQNGIACPSPVPPVPPARQPRAGLGSAGLPWHVPTPSPSPLRLVRCCDPGRAARLGGIASCSSQGVTPLVLLTTTPPVRQLSVASLSPGFTTIRSWCRQLVCQLSHIAVLLSTQYFTSSTMTPTVRAKPPCSPPHGSFILILLTKGNKPAHTSKSCVFLDFAALATFHCILFECLDYT